MASTTLKELQYRRFNDLLNEVYIDLSSFTREGMVEPAQLIKIAQKCNYELGLKIYKTKETLLDVEHGRTKLPSDFYMLNFALLCNHHRVIEPGLFNGLHTEDVAHIIPVINPSDSIPAIVPTTCPCFKVTITSADSGFPDSTVPVIITRCTEGVPIFANLEKNKTYNFCASNVVINTENSYGAALLSSITSSFCYNTNNGTIPDSIPVVTPFMLLYTTPPLNTSSIAVWVAMTSSVANTYDTVVTGSFIIHDASGRNGDTPIAYSVIYPAGVTSYNVFVAGYYPYSAGPVSINTSIVNSTISLGAASCPLPPNPPTPVVDCSCPVVINSPLNTCLGTDPWHQNRIYITCSDTMQVNVIEYRSDEIREYSSFEQLRMVPSKEASSFCVNTSFRNTRHTGNIKDGFLWVPTMREHGGHGKGRMYICYLGAMEDEQGNLLVLDHPKINDFYEWAMKERILQNQYLNGEPDLLQRWQMAKKELDTARKEALSITTMPDFYELKSIIETNRRAMYSKYLHPFSSLYANTPGWPWSINSEHI